MTSGHFGLGLFEFLQDLAAHNDRRWFEANRQRYEREVKQPLLRFITDFGPRLRTVSRSFLADPRPVGGSMFRIYRDTRFSRDKSPYKTHAAAHFRHRDGGTDVHAPGFYLHLAPDGSFGGGGLWHPDPAALKKVRDRIVGRPSAWKAVLDGGVAIDGAALKRPPAGYAPDHRFVEDLKRKDLYTMTQFSKGEVSAPDFLDRYVGACRAAAPLVRFLTNALELSW